MKQKGSFHPYALLTVVLWSLAYVFTRLALRYFSPLPLGLGRYLFASAALAIVLPAAKTGLPPKRALPLLIASGLCGFFLYMVTFNTGSQTVSAATSCTVIAAAPIITALLARVFCRERLTALQYISVGVSFCGVLILTLLKLRLSSAAGLAYICAAAVLLSVYNLLQRRLTKLCAPLQATAYSIFFGTIMLLIFTPGLLRELPVAPPEAIACMAALGVLCGAAAYCSWTKALSMAENAASVSNYMFIEPFLTAVLALIIAREPVDMPTALGGAVILLGLFLFYFGKPLLSRLRRR